MMGNIPVISWLNNLTSYHFMMNHLSPSWSGKVSCLLTIQLQTSELLAVKLLEITASHMKAAAILSLF